MQSTVFDFSFTLKNTDNQFYLIDSVYNILFFDFKTYFIGDMRIDYGMSSSIRINNDMEIEYNSIDEYCSECKYRYYINGIHGFMSIFSLEVSEGFSYQPEFLLRDSNYIDILMGRLFHFGYFLHNQQLAVVRGEKYYSMFTHHDILEFGLMSNTEDTIQFTSIRKNDYISMNFYGNFLPVKMDIIGNIGKENRYFKVIENTIRHEEVMYCEKIFELFSVYGGIRLEIIQTEYNLSGFTHEVGFDISVELAEIEEVEEFIRKYAIMSINKDIVILSDIISEYSRIIINKGVI